MAAGTKFEVIKSCEDKRDYKGYVLPNQMRVLLVSDPSTEKSAAAVDVHVGKLGLDFLISLFFKFGK